MAITARFVTVLLGALFALVLGTSVAAACSCALGTPAQYAENADLVARVSVERVDMPPAGSSSSDAATYTMRPTHLWKGDVDSQFEVTSAASSASCGLEGIIQGQDLVLFAGEVEDGWEANLCGGTAPASADLVADLGEAVGPGQALNVPPNARARENPADQQTAWVWPTLAAVAGVGAVIGVARWRLRSSKRA